MRHLYLGAAVVTMLAISGSNWPQAAAATPAETATAPVKAQEAMHKVHHIRHARSMRHLPATGARSSPSDNVADQLNRQQLEGMPGGTAPAQGYAPQR